jgi:hypothetical protein
MSLKAMRRAHLRQRLTSEHRAKIAAALRRNGIRSPALRIWEPGELALLGVLGDAEVAQRSGRTELSVSCERCKLRIEKSDRRGRGLVSSAT